VTTINFSHGFFAIATAIKFIVVPMINFFAITLIDFKKTINLTSKIQNGRKIQNGGQNSFPFMHW
jgi:hypothetical protein